MGALYGRGSLKGVAIPDSMASIGFSVFVCGSQEGTTIPDSVANIGKSSFSVCGILEKDSNL